MKCDSCSEEIVGSGYVVPVYKKKPRHLCDLCYENHCRREARAFALLLDYRYELGRMLLNGKV